MNNIWPSIKIEDLPEVFEILPDDEIYLFQSNNGTFTKLETKIITLSTYFHSKASAEKLKAKTNELIDLSVQFVNWLKEKYPTEKYIKETYSTTDYFDDKYYTAKDQSSYVKQLNDYATKEYGNFKLAETKAKCEDLKLDSIVPAGNGIVTSIKLHDT